MAEILVSTGGAPFDYEAIDTIFAIDSATSSFFSGLDPNKAFEGLKSKLRASCKARGGDAVVFCQFEYREALTDGFIGKKMALEIFGYGTAVKRIQSR